MLIKTFFSPNNTYFTAWHDLYCVACIEMNSAMWHVLERLSSGPVATSNKFAMEQAMLVAILHHHVGSEVGKDRHA